MWDKILVYFFTSYLVEGLIKTLLVRLSLHFEDSKAFWGFKSLGQKLQYLLGCSVQSEDFRAFWGFKSLVQELQYLLGCSVRSEDFRAFWGFKSWSFSTFLASSRWGRWPSEKWLIIAVALRFMPSYRWRCCAYVRVCKVTPSGRGLFGLFLKLIYEKVFLLFEI